MSIVQRSLSDQNLASYLTKQLNTQFPDGNVITVEMVESILPKVMRRIEKCFVHVNNKYFFDGKNAIFSHLHGDQYSMFLYLASNEAWSQGVGNDFAAKIFLLNKALHGIDAYFEIELPEIFLFVHPLGTVLGRAKYSNYFMVYQGCGVGSNHDIYPHLAEHVTLRPGSFVLGKSNLSRNCTLAAHSLVLDKDVAENTVYIGNPRDFKTKSIEKTLPIWRE